MSSYPSLGIYNALYAKYLDKRSPADLVNRALPLEGMRVVDLCCGGGRLSSEVLKHSPAKLWMIDECPVMTHGAACLVTPETEKRIHLFAGYTVFQFLHMADGFHPHFDAVFCQQGINYWANQGMIEKLASLIPQSGYFVFNTFWRTPPTVPEPKIYEFDHSTFVELSWLDKEMGYVHHVQVRDGMAPHTTSFRFIPASTFEAWLEPFFDINVQRDGNTDIYTCTRNSTEA